MNIGNYTKMMKFGFCAAEDHVLQYPTATTIRHVYASESGHGRHSNSGLPQRLSENRSGRCDNCAPAQHPALPVTTAATSMVESSIR